MARNVVLSRIGKEGPVIEVEVTGEIDPEEDVSALTRAVPFDSLVSSISAVSQAMTDALRRARPEEAEVTFGVDVSLESGQLTSLIVKGNGTATFTIRLLWKSSDGTGDPNAPVARG